MEAEPKMNIKEIKEMIILMNENNLQEIEIEKDGLRIRLKKESIYEQKALPTNQAPNQSQIIVTQETVPAAPPQQNQQNSKLIEIKAPMVGTFYRAPAPEAQPFVEIGQIIDVGQVLCIIEAMKLMNEIKSEVKGKIVEILVENGNPVEFGQPLFLVEPT